ncbi:NAD(P)-dependent oxidoreductase [Streptomyces sp. NPDC048641]|uniref:NAD(P)-dependent oxidoreductase n=1 Tax=unclassified Streptomyces TaxID=2593676 RepID=UPI00342F33A2
MTGRVKGQMVGHFGELERAVVLIDPALPDSVREGLEKITGRTVARYDASSAPDPGQPVIHVGPVLPESLRGGRLRWFHSTNAGIDALLASGTWPEGALLTRTVGRMGERIAQYVLAWILAECQTVPSFLEQQRRAEWRRVPSELAAGQLALVYGAGRIGERVAAYLRGCGIRTLNVARTARTLPDGGEVVTAETADAQLGRARWVVSALPLTAGTENYFGAERFAALRGATFLNTGRGAAVDLAALAAALDEGTVRAAVLDVLREEPAASDDVVWRLPRTVITSHSAGITAPDDVCADFALCWDELRAGRTPVLAVDPGRGY